MSNETDRDAMTDRLLRRSLGSAVVAAPGPDCVEPETLAAWVEGALPRTNAAQVERHLSSCAHCQAVLATFAETEPAVAAVVPPKVPFWERWSLRWLVPMTVGAAAVLLWTVVSAPAPGDLPTQMARVEVPEPAPPPVVVTQPDAQPEALRSPSETPASPGPSSQMNLAREDRARMAQSMAASKAGGATPPPAPPPPPAVLLPSPGPASAASSPAPVAEVAAGAGVASASREFGAQPRLAAPQDNIMMDGIVAMDAPVVAEFVVGALAAADGRALRAEPPPPSTAIGGGRVSAPMAGPPRPMPIRWRVSASGEVQRLVAGSSIWEGVAISPPAFITNGAAPSASVCWLVGRGGVVLRTTNGQTFVRVPFPDDVDLTGVVATSASNARVTTADGRVLVTTDGVSWK